MTAEALAELPDDGQRHELIAGVLTTMSPAGHVHGRIGMRLAGPLQHFVAAHDLGEVYLAETGFLISREPDTVLAPDVAFVGRERAGTAEDAGGPWFPGPPDFAVEIVSPSDRYTEVDETVALWLAAGARLVMVVDPRRRTVSLHRSQSAAGGGQERHVIELGEADTIEAADLLPGWSLPVAALFREPRAAAGTESAERA